MCVSFRPQELSSAENQSKACRNNRQAQHRNEVREGAVGAEYYLNLENDLGPFKTLPPSVYTLHIFYSRLTRPHERFDQASIESSVS